MPHDTDYDDARSLAWLGLILIVCCFAFWLLVLWMVTR